MALYQNGILVSGANQLPQMTMAEYLAIPASDRPTYWICTDRDYDDLSADNVTYGSGSVADALDNKVSKSGDTMSGNLTVDRADGTTETVGQSWLLLGNNSTEGTQSNSKGILSLFGKGAYRAQLKATNVTANRDFELPNKSGTLALLETAVNKTAGSFNGNSSVNYTFATTGIAYLLVSTWNAAAMWIIKAEASNTFIFEVYNSDNNFSCTKDGSTITITNNHAQGGNYTIMF